MILVYLNLERFGKTEAPLREHRNCRAFLV
jgi:hypothetical protein